MQGLGKPPVLLVEDDAAISDLIRRRLSPYYEVVTASTDEAACAHLRARGPEFKAVLMDLNLPGCRLDGLGMVRVIRGKPPPSAPAYAEAIGPLKVPIFITSAATGIVTRADVQELGIDGWVYKPIDFRFMLECLAEATRRGTVSALPRRDESSHG